MPGPNVSEHTRWRTAFLPVAGIAENERRTIFMKWKILWTSSGLDSRPTAAAVGIAYIKYNATDSLNNRSFMIFAPTRIRPLLSSGHDFWQAPERQISLEEWTRSRRRRRHCGKRETCEKHYLTSNFDSIHHDDKSCLYQQVTGNRPSFPKESFSCGIDSFPATFHYHLLKREIAFKDGETCIWPGRASDGHSNTIKIPWLPSGRRREDAFRPFVRRQFRSFRFTSFCRRAFKKAAALRVIPN